MGEAKQPSGKCPKLSDGEQNMGSIDRLSSLPDEVICHILSFLPTKRSVATSILGKRWRFLWAHVPCLDFSGDDFKEEGTHASNSFWEEETQDSEASDIIHRVILQHKAERMDTLTLSYVKFNEYQLEAWITTAIDRSIRNLYLQLNLYTFPRSLFNCKTIVDLKLDNYRASLSAVDNVSLPSLKKLHVNNVVCENDDALPRFLSGCPLLEELNMAIYFQYDYAGCINISSPTIKKLKLDIDYSFRPFNLEYRIIINAPALRYLQVYGYDFALEWITIPITMNSLVEADIHFKNYFYPVKTDCNSMEVKFLHSLCYVKCLKISGWRLGEFIYRGLACPAVKFDNLTKLEVELQLNFKWSLLVKFLHIADNLEVLICDQVDLEKVYLAREPKHVPKCLLSCLRTITIKSMRFKEHEFEMVRYLLRNSRVLERMELFTCEFIDVERKFQALKRISLFDRGSNACQLAFH